MALPKGYHYAAGSGRKLVTTPSGGQISRQAAENLFARSHGFGSEYERKSAMQSTGFKAFRGRPTYTDSWNEAKAAGTSKAEFNAAMARYHANPSVNRNDNSPDGAKAQMLEAMGRRSPGADYNVGESPSVM